MKIANAGDKNLADDIANHLSSVSLNSLLKNDEILKIKFKDKSNCIEINCNEFSLYTNSQNCNINGIWSKIGKFQWVALIFKNDKILGFWWKSSGETKIEQFKKQILSEFELLNEEDGKILDGCIFRFFLFNEDYSINGLAYEIYKKLRTAKYPVLIYRKDAIYSLYESIDFFKENYIQLIGIFSIVFFLIVYLFYEHFINLSTFLGKNFAVKSSNINHYISIVAVIIVILIFFSILFSSISHYVVQIIYKILRKTIPSKKIKIYKVKAYIDIIFIFLIYILFSILIIYKNNKLLLISFIPIFLVGASIYLFTKSKLNKRDYPYSYYLGIFLISISLIYGAFLSITKIKNKQPDINALKNLKPCKAVKNKALYKLNIS